MSFNYIITGEKKCLTENSQGNKLDSEYIYANHLDKEKDILYMCRDTNIAWREKLLKELDNKEVRIFYRNNKINTSSIELRRDKDGTIHNSNSLP